MLETCFFRKHLAISFLGLAAFSCGGLQPSEKASQRTAQKEQTSSENSTNNSMNCQSGAIDLQKDIMPIINTSCVACHGSGGAAPNLTSTQNVEAQRQAIASAVASNQMPPGSPLGNTEKSIIDQWGKQTTLKLALAESPPTYEGTIVGIIGPKCTECHSASAPPSKRQTPYLTSYSAVKGKAGDILQEMQQGTMPPRSYVPALVSADISAFSAWKNAGYPVGTPAPPPNTTGDVVYNNTIKDFLKARCTSCHTPGLKNPDLTTYDAARAAATLALNDMNAGTMPPSGKLPQAEIDLFANWKTLSFPLGDATSASDTTQNSNSTGASQDSSNSNTSGQCLQ